MRFFISFVLLVGLLSCADQEAVVQQKAPEPASKTVQKAMPGLVHTVLVWLRDDLTEVEKAEFIRGMESLNAIETVQSMTYGPPAPTAARPVVDHSFSYAMTINFEDMEAQNAYQVHPIHEEFVEQHKDKWTKVVVYDNLVEVIGTPSSDD